MVNSLAIRTTSAAFTNTSVKFSPTTTFTLDPLLHCQTQSHNRRGFPRGVRWRAEPVIVIVRVANVEIIDHPVVKDKIEIYDDSSVLINVVVFEGQEYHLSAVIGSALFIVVKFNVHSLVESSLIMTQDHLGLDIVRMPFNILVLPQRQSEPHIDQMKSHSSVKVPLETLLENPPLAGIQYVPTVIVINNIDGNLVDLACNEKTCNR